MRVFCAGFNLYGQFLNINDTCIETFKSTIYANAIDLQISHGYLIIKIDENCHNYASQRSKIYLHGFLRNEFNQNEELTFNINDTNDQISVSDSRALFLCRGQKIFSFSYSENSDYNLTLLPDLTVTDEIKNGNQPNVILKVASGTCMSNAYSNHGHIYNIPSRLACKIPSIKDICTGREHCLILSDDGLVYSFGGGSRGQLGHGDIEDRGTPELVKSLDGIKIIRIACGAWHSVALSATFDLYTWGWNCNGQLGLNTNINRTSEQVSIMASPRFVELHVNIIDVSCGSRHTVVLSESSQLYGCGWNKYCQLGFKCSDENHFQFKLLYDFSKFHVIGLRCGPWSTAVLVNDSFVNVTH